MNKISSLCGIFAALVLALPLVVVAPGMAEAAQAPAAKKKAEQPAPSSSANVNVYEKQPPVTDKELLDFLELLPQFRAWAKGNNEEAHPIMRNNKADFLYSPNAAAWVQAHNWNPVRFFCVMGRMAAALSIVEEGNDMSGARSKDMPEVSEGELALARRHLGTMLKAGGDVPPINK
ncbi:MAG: serine/threonine protein phosphatase [Desulfovibrio sp.]